MLSRRTLILCTAAATLIPASAMAQGRTGRFEGRSDHATLGTARVIQEGTAAYVDLGEDFSLDGAPDPQVALGANGYDPATLMGKLGANTGPQRYRVPAGVDIAAYNEVWIWCVRFEVPLGVARLG